jgi:uncharacterized protein YuzE
MAILRIDPEVDVLYIQLADTSVEDSEEVEQGIVLDYAADGSVIGVEVLNISQRVARAAAPTNGQASSDPEAARSG